MPDPAPIVNPDLSTLDFSDPSKIIVGGQPAAAPIATPATLGVTDRTGRPIPDASIADAIAIGEATFTPDRAYDLIDPDGLPKRVKGQHVYNAMRQGWSLESTEGKELRLAKERATLGDKLAAGALGVGESLTLGTLPGLVEGFTGKEGAKSYRKTRAASEEAATIGEVLGLLTPLGVEGLAAKGAGAASKLGRGAMTAAEIATIAPRTVSGAARGIGKAAAAQLPEASTALGQALRKGAQLGVEGAVEGSVYGAGFAVGEASLGNKELAAERVLADAGAGALLGFGFGGGLGAASVGASRAAARVGAELPGFAEKMAFRSTGARGSEMRRVGLDQARASGRRMLDEGLVGFQSLEERAIALRKATEDAGQEVGKLIEKIDETGQRPLLKPIIEKFDEQLGKLREGVGADVRLAKKLDRDFGAWFRERATPGAKPPTFKELHKIRGRIDDHLEQATKSNNSVVEAQLRQLRRNVEEEIQSQADKLARSAGDEFSGAYTAAKSRYKDLIKATEIAEKQAPMQAHQSFGFFDKAAAIGGLLTAGPVGLLAAGASKLAREHGDVAAALLANKISTKGTKPPNLAQVMAGAPPAANEAAGIVRPALPPAEVKAKLEALGYVKEKADKVALQLSKATKDAVTATAHKVVPKVPSGAATYEALAADAREHRAAPDRSALKIAARVAPLVESAPQLASAVNAKLTGDLGYLAQQLPSAGRAGLTPEQAKKVVPSGSERASFVRKAKAIKDPRTIVFDMKNGQLSQDAIDAIKERRPLSLTQIQEEAEAAYAQLVKEGKAPSRQFRLQFEKLTGRKIDPASNPVVIQIVQQHYADQAAAMAAPVPPTPQTSMKRADRFMSQSEEIAYGEQ